MSVMLTLMRHGIAEPQGPGSDAMRALTEEGRAQVAAAARQMITAGWRPESVVHSPLLRARQTAEIVLELLPPQVKRVELQEVIEGGPQLLTLLGNMRLKHPLVVGHQPSISDLAALLLQSRGQLPFSTASTACFRVSTLPPISPAELVFFVPSGLLSAR